MKLAVASLAIAVTAGMVLLAIDRGAAGANVALLGLIVAAGVLTAVVTMRSGTFEPAVCNSCGGLNSTSAPYCTHCGAPRSWL